LGFDNFPDDEDAGTDTNPVHWREVIHILSGERTEEAERLMRLPYLDVMKMILVRAKYNKRLKQSLKETAGKSENLEHLREYIQ
jgi:hypothetical protein